jgi:chemotaxis protein methyltransferase CheR
MSHVPEQLSSSGRKSSIALVPGEFTLTMDDFRQIASMLQSDAGIHLSDAKAALVYSRLVKRLRALGIKSFKEYCAIVASSNGASERSEMLSALTTNVTRFFREPHHFEHFKSTVLPPLLDAASRGGRVRIWSAACSSGQEPYSIALCILSLMPDAASRDIKILATDIDPIIVAEAKAGRYVEATMDGIAEVQKRKHFSVILGDGERKWLANEELRSLVTFQVLNLHSSWPMKGTFQVIFCRNCVIYFNEEVQQATWLKFVPKIQAGGWLYIGHSERVSGPAAAKFRSTGITTYRRTGGASK